jgi:hypothetical protein
MKPTFKVLGAREQQDAARWKHIASYFADCHAATLEWLPRSTSKTIKPDYCYIPCEEKTIFVWNVEIPRSITARSDVSVAGALLVI